MEVEFEKDIVSEVRKFLEYENYEVKEHISINATWEPILYEIDLLAVKGNDITVVEVKPRRDKISRAKDQIDRFPSLIDYGFVTSDIMEINKVYT